jgi:4-oxalocrotonate tautomerase
MPLLNVQLFAGRSVEQKRALAQALTEACTRVLGVAPQTVDVIYTDVEKHDWATAGRLWSDEAPATAPPPAA